MRFHYVDRVTSIVPNHSISGIKAVSSNEAFLTTDSQGMPALSPELLVECLAQLGVWFLMSSSGGRDRAVLLAVGEATFRSTARPGDVLELNLRVESRTAEAAVVTGHIDVGELRVMEMAECLCAIVPAGDLEPVQLTRRRYERLIGSIPADEQQRAGIGVETWQ